MFCDAYTGVVVLKRTHPACFLGALQLVAGQTGKKELAANAKIHTSVHIGEPNNLPGFGIAVEIEVEGVPDEQLIQAAHAVRISRYRTAESNLPI